MDYCQNNNIDIKKKGCLGNDINYKNAMEITGVKFCPADADESIKAISDHVFNTRGGYGVVRELFDLIIDELGV